MRKYIRDSFRIFYESLVTVVDEAVDKFLGWLDRDIEPEWKQCDSCTCEPFTETEVRPLQAAVDVAIAPLVEERVAALTAERDDWHESATHRLSEGMRFRAERDAARAELAAANARCAELEAGIAKLRDGMHEFMRGNWPESPTPVEVYSALAALTAEKKS